MSVQPLLQPLLDSLLHNSISSLTGDAGVSWVRLLAQHSGRRAADGGAHGGRLGAGVEAAVPPLRYVWA